MNLGEKICTCTDKKCPAHPSNHNMGCVPCVNKNLSQGEIPSCFFKKVNGGNIKGITQFTFESFADIVNKQKLTE